MKSTDNYAATRNLSALVDFGNLINSSLDLDFALNNLLLTCLGKFHATRGLVILKNDDGTFDVKAVKGIKQDKSFIFPVIDIDNIENDAKLESFLSSYNLCIHQKIESSRNTIGVLFLGKKLTKSSYDEDDRKFLRTLVNISASAIENCLMIEKLKEVNRNLDAKVNQLSSLFDLSKEFSSILEEERVGKLLVYSIIGQLLVTRFAVITCSEEGYEILETRISKEVLTNIFATCDKDSFSTILIKSDVQKKFPELFKLGIELIIPMQIKSVTKGIILLGSKSTKMQFTQSDIEYISSIGGIAIIAIENGRLFKDALEKQRLEKDLEIAQNIQRNLLPDKIPTFNNFEIAAVNQSARQVGGDYYDIIKLDKERTLFAIADVSGKGVQAALLMANLQAFLQSISKQNIGLNEASNLINDLVSENTTDGSFITFFWGIVNDDTKNLIYVNMGHNPPLLVRKGELKKLKIGGMILGVMPTVIPYKSEEISLESGDLLVLFTDGITEAMNKDGEEFSDEKLEKLVISSSQLSAQEVIDKIIQEVKLFTQGTPQSDDITAMVIKVN